MCPRYMCTSLSTTECLQLLSDIELCQDVTQHNASLTCGLGQRWRKHARTLVDVSVVATVYWRTNPRQLLLRVAKPGHGPGRADWQPGVLLLPVRWCWCWRRGSIIPKRWQLLQLATSATSLQRHVCQCAGWKRRGKFLASLWLLRRSRQVSSLTRRNDSVSNSVWETHSWCRFMPTWTRTNKIRPHCTWFWLYMLLNHHICVKTVR